MKPHYKLSSLPIEAGCTVVIVRGFMQGQVHEVRSTLNNILWTDGLVFRDRTLWGAKLALRIQDGDVK